MEITNYHNPRLLLEQSQFREGSVGWRSPSNLAIIKYWGKYGVQLPRNPSISFTLDEAHTETTLYFSPKPSGAPGGDIDQHFFFEDQPNEIFGRKIQKYLESLTGVFPFLRQFTLVIRSRNSFPHSSGIASSASGMSALALCLCSLEQTFFGTPEGEEAFFRKASYLARLGSGSACRSVFPVMAAWGETREIADSSDLYAVPVAEQIHPVFQTFHDDILIASREKKPVSSRSGHALMDENPYANIRYEEARRQLHNLLSALRMGDVEQFGLIAEAEAFTLHGLMMLSNPPFLLLKSHTISMIERIQAFRREQNIPLFFSLDAGPNLHVLYPDAVTDSVQSFIQRELLSFCENRQWIADRAGKGPQSL